MPAWKLNDNVTDFPQFLPVLPQTPQTSTPQTSVFGGMAPRSLGSLGGTTLLGKVCWRSLKGFRGGGGVTFCHSTLAFVIALTTLLHYRASVILCANGFDVMLFEYENGFQMLDRGRLAIVQSCWTLSLHRSMAPSQDVEFEQKIHIHVSPHKGSTSEIWHGRVCHWSCSHASRHWSES